MIVSEEGNLTRRGAFPRYWPQAMKRKTAAAYLDMSEAAFEREVFQGRLPASFVLGGREHWLRDAIDRALDHLSGSHKVEPDYRRRAFGEID